MIYVHPYCLSICFIFLIINICFNYLIKLIFYFLILLYSFPFLFSILINKELYKQLIENFNSFNIYIYIYIYIYFSSSLLDKNFLFIRNRTVKTSWRQATIWRDVLINTFSNIPHGSTVH